MNNEKEKEIELENQKEEINEIVGDYKYGFRTDVENIFDTGRGINEDVVRLISKMKNEPEWMLDIRLKAYHELQNEMANLWT